MKIIASRIKVCFISHIREITGAKERVLDFGSEDPPTLTRILDRLERIYRKKGLRLLNQAGLLIYLRNSRGGLDLLIERERIIPDQAEIVLATGMEGG